MGNENLNLLKSAGKSIMNEIASELSESGITEALIKNGIPVNKIMTNSAKGKSTAKINTNKSKSSNKKKQNKNKKEGKPENNKEKEKQSVQKKISEPKAKNDTKVKFCAASVTTEQLRNAVVWSEILGEPVSRKKRNNRRKMGDSYGNQCYACRR